MADVAVLRQLPPVSSELCEKRSARVSSTALERYRGTDYSVPTRFGSQNVVIKGFVDKVVILSGTEEIARHMCWFGSGDFVAEQLHYIALIKTQPNAFGQAEALQIWVLPDVIAHLRQLPEGLMGRKRNARLFTRYACSN